MDDLAARVGARVREWDAELPAELAWVAQPSVSRTGAGMRAAAHGAVPRAIAEVGR
ncbi:hypothetical protein [Saccharothrix sp. ALI-22-I]|uniref:hypothetical protein n=1 Tax=Saccharothrix sp. ALI-22-I TaxID=1933778 RepID=UPI0015C3D31C|nr:hypothetical protein [Saccharothrix sp. ALI-22-I]